MIAVDALGGDFAPAVVLEGALACAKTHGISITLFGPEMDMRARLNELDPAWASYPLALVNASEFIEMGEEPVQAVRKKKDASLVRAVRAVRDGTCSAVVSAGNSGAVFAASLFILGCNKGVERPALAGILPGIKKSFVCLDLGANTDCKPHHLYQFAHLGVQYAGDMFGLAKPTVALLANGAEPGKGSLLTKDAFKLLQKATLNFIGNVEPGDMFNNKADVVVCDGFSGNVLLKTLEASLEMCLALAGQQGREVLKQGLTACHVFDQGGGLLLGIQKPALVVHGNASAQVIEQAIQTASRVTRCADVSKYGVV